VGKFIDEKAIALGMPLANAYKLESLVALYPRIVISNEYKNLLDAFEDDQTFSEKSITLKKYLVKSHCEVHYINTFFYLIDREDKIEILTALKTSIINNLETSAKSERIAIKYEWLASQFNSFIDEYVANLRFLETQDPTDEEIQTIQLLKI
jgi:hypothetical protein